MSAGAQLETFVHEVYQGILVHPAVINHEPALSTHDQRDDSDCPSRGNLFFSATRIVWYASYGRPLPDFQRVCQKVCTPRVP